MKKKDPWEKEIIPLIEVMDQAFRRLGSQGDKINKKTLTAFFIDNPKFKRIWNQIARQKKFDQLENKIQQLEEKQKELVQDVETLSSQKNYFEKQVTSLKSLDFELTEFLKRGMAVLISMLRTPDNKAYFETLDQLRALLTPSEDINEMDRLLGKLQKIALWEEERFSAGGVVSRKDEYLRMQKAYNELQQQVEKLTSQRNKFEKHLAKQEDDALKREQFFIRIINLLMNLLRTPENRVFHGLFDRLKKLLNERASIERMNKVITTIQNVSLQEDAPVVTGAENLEPDSAQHKNLFDAFKEVLLFSLAEFQMVFSEPEGQKVTDLTQNIRQSMFSPNFFILVQSYLDLFKQYASIVNEKKQTSSPENSLVVQDISDAKNNETIQIDTQKPSNLVRMAEEMMDDTRKQEVHMSEKQEFGKVARFWSNLKKKMGKTVSEKSTTLPAPQLIQLPVASENASFIQEEIEKIKKEITQLRNLTRFLESELLVDSQTGIFNRRAFERRLNEEMHRFKNNKQAFSVILFDIDQFRTITQNFGYTAANACLSQIGRKIKTSLRNKDYIARYGNDEFIILLPDTEDKEACEASIYLMELIRKIKITHKNKVIPINISIAVTQSQLSDKHTSHLNDRLHKAMFQAKKGPGRVICGKPSGLIEITEKTKPVKRLNQHHEK
jgi:diguanylate cyclase (GGDEF)-like protein